MGNVRHLDEYRPGHMPGLRIFERDPYVVIALTGILAGYEIRLSPAVARAWCAQLAVAAFKLERLHEDDEP